HQLPATPSNTLSLHDALPIYFRGQSVRTSAGRAIRMAGAMTDTTDRRLTAAELFAEKERAQVTLASIADGVITTDTDGWVEYLKDRKSTRLNSSHVEISYAVF